MVITIANVPEPAQVGVGVPNPGHSHQGVDVDMRCRLIVVADTWTLILTGKKVLIFSWAFITNTWSKSNYFSAIDVFFLIAKKFLNFDVSIFVFFPSILFYVHVFSLSHCSLKCQTLTLYGPSCIVLLPLIEN